MFNDKEKSGERVGERPSEERSEYADRWEAGMTNSDDVPDFAGEWGYGDPAASGNTGGEVGAPEAGDHLAEMQNVIDSGWDELSNLDQEWQDDPATEQAETSVQEDLQGAGKITSYGFDTASRIYGLETVIDKIVKTDELVDNAENPLGAIYQAIEPNPDGRARLYNEIQKDRVQNNHHNDDPSLNTPHSPLGFSKSGDFYDKAAVGAQQEQSAIEAIRAVRKLMERLETDEDFEALRERAYQRDQTLIENLMEEIDHPTFSQFFNAIGAEASGQALESVLEEMEDEAEEDLIAEDEARDGAETESEEAETYDREAESDSDENIGITKIAG